MNKRATENNLNNVQFEQLKEMYINTIVDSMSIKDLMQYVANDMADFLNKLSESGVYNEIEYTLDEEMLEEFITTIKEESEDKMQQNDIKNVFKCYFKCKSVFYLLLLVD